MYYSIGEVAKILNLAPSAIRYYEKEGLLSTIQKSATGIRVFTEEDLEWLKVINCLKKTGMPIKEIKEFSQYLLEGDSSIDKRLKLLNKQREYICKQIEEYTITLKYIDYKCSFYEQAKKLGSTKLVTPLPIDTVLSRK